MLDATSPIIRCTRSSSRAREVCTLELIVTCTPWTTHVQGFICAAIVSYHLPILCHHLAAIPGFGWWNIPQCYRSANEPAGRHQTPEESVRFGCRLKTSTMPVICLRSNMTAA